MLFCVDDRTAVPPPWDAMDFGTFGPPAPAFESLYDFCDAIADDPLTYAAASLFVEDIKGFFIPDTLSPFILNACLTPPSVLVRHLRLGDREFRQVAPEMAVPSEPKRDAPSRDSAVTSTTNSTRAGPRRY